jgi:ubiquinone biosynthesis protein COQ4
MVMLIVDLSRGEHDRRRGCELSSGRGGAAETPRSGPAVDPRQANGYIEASPMNLSKMLHMIRAYRAGAPLGDVVVLKADALSEAPASMAARLAPLQGYVAPSPDLPALRKLPAGTLGREYARFLDANGIEPLVVSAATKERFRDQPYALRYTTTHDLHHALAGFDAGLAGEMGVLAFNVGQGSAPVSRGMLLVGGLFLMLLSPTQARRIWHNARVGLRMGKDAALVIAAPVETWFAEPLDEVRRRLGIADPRAAGVRSSGSSILAGLVYSRA